MNSLSFHLILVKELDKRKGYVENSKQLLNTLKYFAFLKKNYNLIRKTIGVSNTHSCVESMDMLILLIKVRK